MASVEFSASFERLQRRYRNVAKNSPIRRDGLILWAMQEGQKEAINQANIAIYDKPDPTGMRTGNLKRAIKIRKLQRGTDSGEVYLDKATANRGGFYYPKLREGPPEGWPTSRNYPQDPYWRNAKLLTAARLKSRARQTLKSYKTALTVG